MQLRGVRRTPAWTAMFHAVMGLGNSCQKPGEVVCLHALCRRQCRKRLFSVLSLRLQCRKGLDVALHRACKFGHAGITHRGVNCRHLSEASAAALRRQPRTKIVQDNLTAGLQSAQQASPSEVPAKQFMSNLIKSMVEEAHRDAITCQVNVQPLTTQRNAE